MTPAIDVQQLTKDFINGDLVTPVLHGITMHVPRGELSMLVGPSGCGKTTLISIISGILSPTSGTVFINGTDITHLNDREKVLFRRKNVGFIFQQYNLLPALTAVENVAVPLDVAKAPHQEALEKAAHVLKQVGLGNHLNKLPEQLSGGQQQRVAIARALIHHPAIIVCDEPTAALDAHTGHKVMDILKQQAHDYQATLIVVTHDSRILEFADRTFTMDDGRIIGDQARGISVS